MPEPGRATPGEPSRTPQRAVDLSTFRAAVAETALSLDFDLASQPGRIIVRVGGELDMMTAPPLRDALLPLVADMTADVVLNFDQVSFLGSTALSVLVEAWRQAQQTGAALRIVAADTVVTRPLMLTGLDQVLQLYETVADLPPVASSGLET